MEETRAIEELLSLSKQLTPHELRQKLIVHVNHLLLNDFNKLVQMLYRVDVSEKKLKELLQANPQTDAAIIIADLLIERQQQKIKTKESFRTNNDIPDEDKW